MKTIVTGTDTHKRMHMLSAVDEGTGKVRGVVRSMRVSRGTWLRSTMGARAG